MNLCPKDKKKLGYTCGRNKWKGRRDNHSKYNPPPEVKITQCVLNKIKKKKCNEIEAKVSIKATKFYL